MFQPGRRLTAAFFFVIAPAFGTTYYVDSVNGSDSNSGTSTSAAWQTITKVDKGPYNPGDSVLFKSGDTWTGNPTFTTTLTMPSAGSSGSPITYGSYGTGAAPILDGANSLSTGINIAKSYVTITGLQVQNVTGSAIYVTGSNVNITYSTLVNASSYGIDIQGSSNVLVDHTTYSTSSNWGMGRWAFFATTTGPITYTYDTCDLRGISSSSQAGCFVVNGSSSVRIQYNYAYGGQQSYSIKPYPADPSGCQGPEVTGGIISDNYSGGVTTQAGGDGEGIEAEGCSSYPQTGIVVTRNVMICVSTENDAIGIYESRNGLYLGNIVIGGCLHQAFHFTSASTGNLVYNNTISDGSATVPYGFNLLSNSTATFSNNIIDGFGVGIEVQTGASVTEDYDLFTKGVGTPSSGATLGPHTKTGTNPLFINSTPAGANDVKLLANSPATGTGASLGSPYNLILNPVSIASPYGTYDQSSSWMRGAFGYAVANVPLSITGAKMKGGIVVPH